MSEVCVTEVEPQVVVGMWKRGTYAEAGVMIRELRKYAEASGAGISGPPVFICHETPREAVKANEEATADVEVVVPIANVVDGQGSITCYEIPGGQMAKIVHKGPYEKSAPTYKKLFEWIAANHKKVAGPTREVYLNDPREVPAEDLLTEIYAPIT
ncbi:MAG: GyrI-like domain-containing protein [Phycisphaerales bacterium]|nr:MAG: GyrI-like domain-containing protein [Phycisphaerales bacterium]UCF17876.1 MAG: GyrI-like domain-containing protein [Phycisphaerales bacterium]